jgi:hypothetical protein
VIASAGKERDCDRAACKASVYDYGVGAADIDCSIVLCSVLNFYVVMRLAKGLVGQ